jgi:inorganic triphosphatase YgiF
MPTTHVEDKNLTTADLAAAEKRPAQRTRERFEEPASDDSRDSRLAPLFSTDIAEDFRGRWTAVQTGFVDDPTTAGRDGDELVAQVMKNLADSFARERRELETQLEQSDKASTEDLRVALRRYRSFFERLLSL